MELRKLPLNNEFEGYKRYEHKYMISKNSYFTLKQKLKFVMKKDINTLNDIGYNIRSQYYDTIENESLFNKTVGIQKRSRYRIRTYNKDKSLIKLEKKTRANNISHKYFEKIDMKLYKGIYENSIIDTNSLFVRSFLTEKRYKLLRPVISIDYEREAFNLIISNLRVTFDKNLRFSYPKYDMFIDHISYPVIDKDVVILEIKFDRMIPDYIKDILSTEHAEKISISKYEMCMLSKLN